jgi:hypothetical protein
MSKNPAFSNPGPHHAYMSEILDISLSIRDLMDRIDANWDLSTAMKEYLVKELMLTV